jgi:hypothetical protein
VYGARFMVYGVWCMVYGVWCMVYGLWVVVQGSERRVRSVKITLEVVSGVIVYV